jgi:polyisoprenoid-binding protein YceI
MKKVIATLIAGLFATAAFAQTPAAPAAPAKVEAAHTKAVVKADAKEAQRP